MILRSFAEKLQPKNGAIFLIKIYKIAISPYFRSSCRYYPSCSSYAMTAYQTKSFFKASLMTAYRLIRCNPFSRGGYDPVDPDTAFKLDKEI